MKIIRVFDGKDIILRVGLSLLCCFAGGQAYADDVCSGEPDDMAVAKCVADQMRASSAELEKDYQEALTKLPDADENYRRTKAQLIKTQAAWKIFVDEQCKLVGALQGGSWLYVSLFDSQCLWDENRKRIEFIKKIPDIE